MERINYSQIIQDILSNHSTNDIANGTEIQLLFDTQRHHYQVLNIGWKQQIRTYGVVLGFHAPYKRQFTGFAVG